MPPKNLVRTEMEALLADRCWHSVESIVARVGMYVDPRAAARSYVQLIDGVRVVRGQRLAGLAMLDANTERGIAVGRRRVIQKLLHYMNCDVRGAYRHRSYRLASQEETTSCN